MFDNLRQDARRMRILKSKPFPWYVLESLLFDNGFQAVVLHRIAHGFKGRKIPVFGPLVARLNLFLTGVDIAPGAVIGPGLLISHGVGLVIGGHARIGADAILLHGVTIGSPSRAKVERMPTVGDRAFIGAGASLIGGITVGNDVRVGIGALVTQDVPDGSKVFSTAEIRIEPPATPPPTP
jgi:serine O-acetyltransferase